MTLSANSSANLRDLETPAVVVLRDVLVRNLDRFQRIASNQSASLRPHIKTHRTLPLARLQMQKGAAGLCCAKLNEAETLADAGFKDIVVAYPLVGPDKARRFQQLARRVDRMACVVDSVEGAESLTADGPVEAFLKTDTGFGRCGIGPDEPDAVERALRIAAVPGLRLLGLLTHAGYAYAGETPPQKCMEQERDGVVAFRKILAERGLELAELSVGSTPTIRFFENTADRAVTEVRPGNYVFMDATQVRLGVAEPEECSMNVLATVVSVRANGTVVLDCGSKVLSSDRGGHGGPAGTPSYGLLLEDDPASSRPVADARIFRLSEEHGWLHPGERKLKVGDKVRILPNHACAVSFLSGTLHLCEQSGRFLESWPVMKRGSR